jgi:hypothetical protein
MTEQEVQEIYNRLLELTKAGKIKWEKTEEEEFTTNFSRSSVSVGIEGLLFGEQVALKIYNDVGNIVAYAAQKPVIGLLAPEVKTFNLNPSELYKLVDEGIEEGLYKYSETSRSILDELKELEFSQKGK